MYKIELEPITKKSPISHDILHLYDEITEFNNYCAFLCDAVACLVNEDEYIDQTTAHGVSQFSHDIKLGMVALKSKLKQIHEKGLTKNRSSKIDNNKLKPSRNKTRSA